MVRWTGKYINAGTNKDQDPSLKGGGRPPLYWRQRETNSWMMWVVFTSSLSLAVWLWSGEDGEHEQPEQSTKTALQAQEKKTSTPQSDQHTSPETQQPTELQSRDKLLRDERERSLLWWVEAAPLPTPLALKNCLSRVDQAPVDLLPSSEGYTILTPGRPRPQTLYERGEQIWLKTPPQHTPHQQAYDHLVLAACLKAPGATLYDPLLVRRWLGDDWPQRDPKSGGIALDDLFVIRSEGSAHYTFGLARLGIAELGVYTDQIKNRSALRRLALSWLLKGKDQDPDSLVLQQQNYRVRSAEQIDHWLGPDEVMVVTRDDGVTLSDDELEKIMQSASRSKAKVIRKKRKKKSRRSAKKRKRSTLKKSRTRKKEKRKSDRKSKKSPSKTPALKYR